LTALLANARWHLTTSSARFRLVAAAGAFLMAGLTASSDDGVVLCPLRRCSGGYCPGCGITRASGQLIRGDVAGSWRQHPFLLLALAQLGLLTATWSVVGERHRTRLRRYALPAVVANTVLLVALWVARMLMGAVPVPFA
jgi:hypothetical protein